MTANRINSVLSERSPAVEHRLSSMSEEDLVGQLLCVYHTFPQATGLISSLEKIGVRPGGMLLMLRGREQALADTSAMQSWNPIPMLVAANLEAGTATFLSDGEAFANPMQIAATRNPENAFRLGEFCAVRGRAVGVNWAFAPVVDVSFNPANPITGTRTFGSDPALVAQLGAEYVAGLQGGGVAASAKHWPGDGVDARDQHLLTSVNDLPMDQWYETYGMVYRRLIEAGVLTVMAAHIALPAWDAGRTDADRFEPASQSRALLTDLLRNTLGFEGLIVSDNSLMAGFTRWQSRREAVVSAVNAGCDMLLGSQFVAEDYAALLDAVRTGEIANDRLIGAVRRVLTLKATLGLFDDARGQQPEGDSGGRDAGFAAAKAAVARESVTLVRPSEAILPLEPGRYRRIVVYVIGDRPTFYEPTGGFADPFVTALRSELGADVDVRHVPDSDHTLLTEHAAQRGADLIVYFANQTFTSDSNTARIVWSYPQAPEVPRQADTPVLVVSIADPYHLQDIPSADVVINAYGPSRHTVDAVVDCLLGREPFLGTSPVDAFAGMPTKS